MTDREITLGRLVLFLTAAMLFSSRAHAQEAKPAETTEAAEAVVASESSVTQPEPAAEQAPAAPAEPPPPAEEQVAAEREAEPAAPEQSFTLPSDALASADVRPIEEVDIQSLLDLAVVTASGGKAQTQSLAAANITAITRDEIVAQGWRSLAEVLSNVGGLYVIRDEVLPSVGVRGVTGGLRAGTRIVKVMVNGVEVNFRPDLTAFLGPEFIPMEAVERIEVAKGPLSALYGANAFLAVVNVITRDQVDGLGEVALRGNAVRNNLGYGASGVVAHGNADRGFLVAFGSDELNRSGLRIEQTFPGQNPEIQRNRVFFADQSRGNIAAPSSLFAQARIGNDTAGRLSFQGGLQTLDSMGDFQLNSITTHQSRYSLQNLWGNLQHVFQITDGLETTLRFGASRGTPTRDERLFLNGSEENLFQRKFNATTLDGLARLAWNPFDRLSVDAGVDVSYEQHTALYYSETLLETGERIDRIGANDVRNPVLYNTGIFAQATYAPIESHEDFQLTGNLRLDFPNLFDPQVSFRAAAANRWSPWITSKVIVGRAFQSPSAVLLYGLPGFGNSGNVVGSQTLPNIPAVTPQTVHSVELVNSFNIVDRVAVELGLYGQQVLDRIEFVQSGFNFRAENQGELFNAGLELKVRGSFDRFSPYAILTFQKTLDEDLQLLGPAPLYPDLWGRAGLTVDVPEVFLKATGQVRVVGPRGASQSNVLLNNLEPYTLPTYTEADLSLTTSGLHLWSDTVETRVSLLVNNLLDARYSEPGFGGFDIPVGGRYVMLELRQGF